MAEYFTEVDSDEICQQCEDKLVTHCIQVGDVSLNLCTVCAYEARDLIVKGLFRR